MPGSRWEAATRLVKREAASRHKGIAYSQGRQKNQPTVSCFFSSVWSCEFSPRTRRHTPVWLLPVIKATVSAYHTMSRKLSERFVRAGGLWSVNWDCSSVTVDFFNISQKIEISGDFHLITNNLQTVWMLVDLINKFQKLLSRLISMLTQSFSFECELPLLAQFPSGINETLVSDIAGCFRWIRSNPGIKLWLCCSLSHYHTLIQANLPLHRERNVLDIRG